MKINSYWMDSAPFPVFPKAEDVSVDVTVIGGGIMGITTAYLLKRAGMTVALLERGRCAMVDTGHTTAHVTAVTDLARTDAVKAFGRDAAKAVWDAGIAAIDQIVSNIRREEIDCDFRWVPGFLHMPMEPNAGSAAREAGWFRKEAEVARELGIQASYLEQVPLFGVPGIKFPHQALFHPRKYLAGLARKIPGGGSYLFEHSEASEIKEQPLVVAVGKTKIRCKRLVLATHNPLMGLAGALGSALFQTKLSLYSSYALGAKIPHQDQPEASYWDTAEPYNYLRIERRRDHDYAIFGGEDHKTGQAENTEENYARLEKRFRRFFSEAEIDHRWSGQVIDTPDGLPYMGEMVEHQFAATGFSGNGMTFATIAADMATDWALGRMNPWSDLFEPGRKKLTSGVWTYLTENKDYPYFMVRDWLSAAEAASLKEVGKGEGKIVGLEGKKVAAYRDDEGRLTLCSPICTHLKCIVGWNTAERTWDCPCHGSRFKPTGEVISGPAEEPLEKLPVND
jgi:glycine/D-amino acid oxidase-like deaminating enzyme/nitrite reductase/ring-hydroxylating ferredoxin subunit